MPDRFCTFCGTRHWPLTDCPTRADLMPVEIVEAVARRLYECEKRRADHSNKVLSDALERPTRALAMEPWEECSETFMGDAKAAINTFLVASSPAEQVA